jgi:hypothetical protein
MHRQIDGTVEQRFFQFLGEKTLALHLIETEVLYAVALRLDDGDTYLVPKR